MYLAVHLFRGAKRQVSDPISRRAASDRPAARSNRINHSRLADGCIYRERYFCVRLGLEAKSPKPVNAARARWEELRLREWKQENRPNQVEKLLTEEEEAELEELMYRFDPLGPAIKAWEEAAAKAGNRDNSKRRRPRTNGRVVGLPRE